MACQIFRFEDPGAYGNNLAANALRRAHIFRGITHKTDRRACAQPSSHLADTFPENFYSQLALVGKAAKLEVVCQPGRLQFEPGHGFQVPRTDSQKLPIGAQRIQNVADPRQHVWPETIRLFAGVLPHDFKRSRHLSINDFIRDPGALQRRPQNPRIGFPVIGNPIDRGFNAINFEQRPMQCIPVRPIRTQHQRPVNIKQVRIRIPPPKPAAVLSLH